MGINQTIFVLFRWLVQLYPTEFRGRFGLELLQGYRDLLRESNSEMSWISLLPDLCLSIFKERFFEWRKIMNTVDAKDVTPPSIPADVLDCLAKGGPAWRQQDYVSARQFANGALVLSRKHNSAHGELGALQLLANIAFNESEDKVSQEIHQIILEKSLSINFSDGVAASLANLAMIDIVDGDYASARAKYYRALEIYDAAGDVGMADSIRTILGYDELEKVLEGIPRKS